jgi:hypothetical protein
MPASPTTSTSHRLSRHLALACASLLTIAPLTADDVIVHSDTIQEINGVSAIPDGLFGITAYDGAATSTDSPWLPILRRSGIRWAGLPGDSRWVFAKDAHPAAGWADSPEALNRLDHPLGGYAIPQCLRAWRDLGIEPMLYLLGYPDSLNGGMATAGKPSITDFPKDPLAAGEMWAEYVALMRRADPQLTWLHLGNEPNASWFQQGHDGREWATIFRAVATAVRERNPGVKIGGPTLCWPLSWPPAQAGSASWYTWKQWAEPLIAQVGDQLDFVDFHLYDASASVGVEEVQTIVNALWLSTGKRIPVMISEYGVYLKPEDIASPARVWRRRVASWQEQVMAFLDLQPDLLLSLQPHDLFADAGGKFTFLKGTDPADQHALARVYRVWAPFRGTRLATSAAQSAVRAFAAVCPRRSDRQPQDVHRAGQYLLCRPGDRTAAGRPDGAGRAGARALRTPGRTGRAPQPGAPSARRLPGCRRRRGQRRQRARTSSIADADAADGWTAIQRSVAHRKRRDGGRSAARPAGARWR